MSEFENLISDDFLEDESISEIFYTTYTNDELCSLDTIFELVFLQEITEFLNNYKNKSNDKNLDIKYAINQKSINIFIKKIFNFASPKILRFNVDIQQLYILHIFTLLFQRLNNNHLHLEYQLFVFEFLLPNLYYLCTKTLVLAKKILNKIIKECYSRIEEESKKIIEFNSTLYKNDSNLIKNQIMNIFLCNVLPKINPLDSKDIIDVYSNIIFRLFLYYIKSKSSKTIEVNNIETLYAKDFSLQSERYFIYENAIYLAHIESICNFKSLYLQINSQYNNIKNTIITNELQKLYICHQYKFAPTDQQIFLFKIYDNLDSLEKFKNKIPLIYRILRSIHIDDGTVLSKNDYEMIYLSIYSVLYTKFKDLISLDSLNPFIDKISKNLSTSLTTGKFIDIFTMTAVNSTGIKFCEQLKLFLNFLLSDIHGEKINEI